MATSTAKKNAAAPASAKLTVMPLFVDQHGLVDEETGETIECYAEHCGSILLSDQARPGSNKPRTLVSSEDYWKAGWEVDEDGDAVDPADVDRDEVKKFVIDPFKTTKQDLEDQFGKRYLFVIATWGDGAPEGKSGLMRGSGHSFFTGGDVLKKRGLPVEEPAPKKNRRAAPAAANDDDEGEGGEGGDTAAADEAKEALEAAEARVTELEEQMNAMREEMKTAFASKPQESFASQFRDVYAVAESMGGRGGANASAQAATQRDQFWQEQIAAARREVSDRERFWNEEVARVRSTAANEASAKLMGYETRLQTLFSENSALRTASVTELAAVHQAQRDDLNRREIAHDNAISTIKNKLTESEVALSNYRHTSDTKISELTALLNGHKLLEMKAGIEKNFETEKLARIEKEHADIKAERDNLKTLNAEQSETIETMRRNLHTPTHSGGDGESSGGFTIPRFVWKLMIPALPMIGMLLYKFFADSGKPFPKEAEAWFRKQAENAAGGQNPDGWADRARAEAEEQERERARKEKEWDDNERERLRREEETRVAAEARGREAAARAESDRAAAAARAEAVENEKREAEKQAAALVEKQAEASRAEAARIEAERVDAARVTETSRAEAARVEAARIEAARVESERAAEALRERARAGTPEERTASKEPAAPPGAVENPIITPLPSVAAESTSGGE